MFSSSDASFNGRKSSINRKQVLFLRQKGLGALEISRQLNISRSTVYKKIENEKMIFIRIIFCKLLPSSDIPFN
ncbi:helix-turn-helix domain-containing protein [Citrobacter europaeus]|uniref:helix-turn-helix domain-containing protein n=1 Tax=Citrobacter europaeus TaxID=1914243 RepID=UPI003356C14B